MKSSSLAYAAATLFILCAAMGTLVYKSVTLALDDQLPAACIKGVVASSLIVSCWDRYVVDALHARIRGVHWLVLLCFGCAEIALAAGAFSTPKVLLFLTALPTACLAGSHTWPLGQWRNQAKLSGRREYAEGSRNELLALVAIAVLFGTWLVAVEDHISAAGGFGPSLLLVIAIAIISVAALPSRGFLWSSLNSASV